MRRIKNWVNHLSVKKKLILYGYLTILPVLLAVFMILVFSNYKRNSKLQLENETNDVASLSESISLLQTEIKDYTTYICVNTDVNRLLTSSDVERLNRNSRIWQEEGPMQYIQDVISIKGDIRSISLYPENGLRPYLRCMDGSAYYADIETIRMSDVYQQTLDSDSGMLWKSVSKSDKEIFSTNRNDKLVLFREIYDLSQSKPLGFMTIGISKGTIQSLCDAIVHDDDEGIMVIDRYGGEICRSGQIPSVIEEYLLDDEFVGMDYRQRSPYFTRDGYTVVCRQKDNGAVIICKILPPVNKQITFMDIAYMPISILIGVLVGLLPLLIIVSNLVTGPLHRLSSAITEVSAGNFNQHVEVKTDDEVGEVARCFNKMVGDIQSLINENYVITLQEKESELAALQAQINPHFLYNTLDTLYWKATDEGSDELAESIFALSQLFRLVLSQGDRQVCIANEMELVSRYLQLQKIRFANRLSYDVTVDDTIKDIRIPKLIVQPFVENAVVHGLENISTPCSVKVSAWRQDDRVCFEIEDTGAGMEKEQIDRLLEQEPEQYAKQRIGGYGIKNIKERLMYLYQDDFTLTIDSTMGKGTKVTLVIPGGENVC